MLALSAVSKNWGSGDSRYSSDKAKYRVMDPRQPLMYDARGTRVYEKDKEMYHIPLISTRAASPSLVSRISSVLH